MSPAGWERDKADGRVAGSAASWRRGCAPGDTVQVLDTTDGRHPRAAASRRPRAHALHLRLPLLPRHGATRASVRCAPSSWQDLDAAPPAAIVVFETGWPTGGYERLDGFPSSARALARRTISCRPGAGYRIYAKRDRFIAIIRAYDDPIVRAYCWGALRHPAPALPRRDRPVPARARAACSTWAAASGSSRSTTRARTRRLTHRGLRPATRGASRWRRAAARRLGLGNVRYEVGDVMEFRGGERFDAAYMLDIVHHIPADGGAAAARAGGQDPAGGRAAARQGRGHAARPTSAGSPMRWTR